jgi:hypothetical protein
MGSQTFNFTGLVNTFTPLAGITDYTFTVAGGGGAGSNSTTGGNGAIVTATYSGLTPSNVLSIIVGGEGSYIDVQASGSGAGMSQVFSTNGTLVNIVAGGGGAGGRNGGTPGPVAQVGGTGGTGGNNVGGAGGTGGGSTGGAGGSGNQNGFSGVGGSAGGGGGSAFTDGTISQGGNGGGAFNGGGGVNLGNNSGYGGGAGYGGGGGGSTGSGGGGGGSIATGTLLSSGVNYAVASVDSSPGGGGLITANGSNGQVVITWTDTPTPPTPTSNICFPAGTPIQTDQGIVNIEQLDKNIHTINSQPILQVTKTVTLDKYLICFEKSSLGRNIPNKKTIMTKDHKIEFQGQMVPAYKMLDYSKDIKKVKYSGEVLYNVLLAEHSLMNVNGLMCETLHPENIIAKLYNGDFTEEERNDIIFLMNDALEKKDLVKYKTALNRIG